jgi:hypothetical protein
MQGDTRMLKSALVIGILFSSGAIANTSSYCQDVTQLSRSVQDCDGNRVFAEAAHQCIKKFEAEAQQANVTLDKKRSARTGTQKRQFQQSQSNLGVTIAVIDDLIAKADRAFENIYDYAFHNVLPEDADLPLVTGTDPEKWAMGEPCFAEARKAIEDGLDLMENYKEDLVEARTILSRLRATSKVEEQNLTGKERNALPQRNSSDRGARPGKPPANRESDVSGYERMLERKKANPNKTVP